MNNKFDLPDIQAFAAVAELQSFRAAAEAIHLSQPAFSRRIDKLEEALGVRLLDRTTRRLTLTAVGRTLPARPACGWTIRTACSWVWAIWPHGAWAR